MSPARANEPDDLYHLCIRSRELGLHDMDMGEYRRERAAAFAAGAEELVLAAEQALRDHLEEIDTAEDRARVERIAAETDAAILRELLARLRPN